MTRLLLMSLAGVVACATARAPAPAPKTLPGTYPITPADVHFMTGMIAHHAQAVIMAGWAPSHGASKSLQALAERIVVAQTDEINMMRRWLGEHGQPVPPATATRMKMTMNGMEHDMLMPGMLTDEEMAALDKARDTEFDRLFLLGMIKHHGGAIQMVTDLNAAPGAGQDEVVFRFSTDVYIDQLTEIERMQKMLNALEGNRE